MFATAIARRVTPASRAVLTKVTHNAARVTARTYYQGGAQYSTVPGLTSQQIAMRALLGAGAAAGVVGLCMIGQNADENTANWQDYVSQRVSSTYGYFGAGLAMTAASTTVLYRSGAMFRIMAEHPIAFSIGGLVLTMGSMILTRSIPYENTVPKLAAWSTFNTCIGATLVPACFMGGPMVLKAAAYTGVVVGGLSMVAMSAKSDQFLSWGQPLAIGLGIVFVTSLGRVFLPARFFVAHSMMDKVVTYGGLAVFSGLVLYDTQKIVYKSKYAANYDPINECLHIYLDTINLFQLILNMMSNRRR